MKRLNPIVATFALLLCPAAAAFPGIYDLWNTAYPDAVADDELIATTGTPCQVCHVNPGGGEPWNQYGYQVLINGGFANVPQAFFDIEALDADGEGNSNLSEINAGALPGWCEPTTAGCSNLAWTRSGQSSPATPPANVMLDPPAQSPPVADAGGPYAAVSGLRVRVSGAASSDTDGNVVAWHWKFGDGGFGDDVAPVHVYATPGTYIVHLKVTDNDGLTALATTTVTVTERDVPLPPTADTGGPYDGVAMMPLTFDGSGSTDLDGSITQWLWNFGDGATGSGPTPSHTYALPGNYTVSLTVIDDDGLSGDATTTATIAQAPEPGETIFRTVCQACHGDPWDGPAIDPTLVAGRRNTGARSCSIQGAINGTFVFPGGVPEMQFLQGVYSNAQIQTVSDFLNSQLPVSGQRRFVTTCAGCHGLDGSGGPVNEDVRGRDADRIYRALAEEPEMAFLSCLPDSDIQAIGSYLETLDDD
ncbi:MAG: PKD domain-containing protein [Gammaproteobacteria bacterium]